MEREIEKARDFAVTGFAKSLLAPLDAMEAALSHMGDDPALAAYRDGTIQIYRLFLKAFSGSSSRGWRSCDNAPSCLQPAWI